MLKFFQLFIQIADILKTIYSTNNLLMFMLTCQ